MDLERIYAQYQKYIATAERMRLHSVSPQEPVPAGSEDLLPSPGLLEPESVAPERGKQQIWRPIEPQEVVTRMRIGRN
jgi:hypothetical protein